ncbi:hypothetical protein ACFXTN_039450 [Malus domestica]
MDIGQYKSEEQMEMTMMMIQMEKISELCGAYNDVVSDLPPSDHNFSSTTTSPNSLKATMSHYTDQNTHNNNIHSPNSQSFLNLPTIPSTISFTNTNPTDQTNGTSPSQKRASMAAMREMIFRIAAMQPINIDPESVKPPKRRNVKISKDPQSVAARHRRERISERIRILQRLVPGGTKMDTASMLDEAIHYVKFLKTQVQTLERAATNRPTGIGFPVAMSSRSYVSNSMSEVYEASHHHQNVQHFDR